MARIGWLIVAVVAMGCQPNLGSAPSATGTPPPAEDTVPGPGPLQSSDLRMIRSERELALGDTWSEAIEVFEIPRNAFEFSQLPPRFATPYRARGWETSREGFGVIAYDDRIVAAFHQRDRVTAEQIDETFELYEQALAGMDPLRVEGKTVRTAFWEQNGQRLMVQAVQKPGNGLYLTVALGVDSVLNELGASPTRAREDVTTLDGALFPEDTPRPSPPSSEPEPGADLDAPDNLPSDR